MIELSTLVKGERGLCRREFLLSHILVGVVNGPFGLYDGNIYILRVWRH